MKASAVLFLSLLLATNAAAMGKKKKSPPKPKTPANGKTVIQILPIQNTYLQTPDGEFYHFGDDFRERLTTQLTNSRKYIVVERETPSPEPTSSPLSHSNLVWPASTTPAAEVRIDVNALSFYTGDGGNRLFYGFDDRQRTPFNDGFSANQNEFPLGRSRTFANTFRKKGMEPFDSLSGLDLGSGFRLDFLFAFLEIKYERYRTYLSLDVTTETLASGATDNRDLTVKAKGYFYDIVGQYKNFSGAIQVARKDAMIQAFRHAIRQIQPELDASISGIPRQAKVDGFINRASGPCVLLGTGREAQIPVGVYFQNPGSRAYLRVIETATSGSIAEIVLGERSDFSIGSTMVETPAPNFVLSPSASLMSRGPAVSQATATRSSAELEAADLKLDRSDFGGNKRPKTSRLRAFFRYLAKVVFLPYRIWRWKKYDQPYMANPNKLAKQTHPMEKRHRQKKRIRSSGKAWMSRIGLDQARPMKKDSNVLVAVIDSGIDYNHPLLHPRMWWNPSPYLDFRRRLDWVGWDFVSGDEKPFDDHFHGTQVAGTVSVVAPEAKLMALKVFDAYGNTSSPAIYSAFEYAISHGAKIILCAWATRKNSRAVRAGVEMAAEAGAIVIAAAGDEALNLQEDPRYPVSLTHDFRNVVGVGGTNGKGGWLKTSNYDRKTLRISAPAQDIKVAEPRNRLSRASHSGIAAAMVAGAIAREWSHDPLFDRETVLRKLYENTTPNSRLSRAVRNGNVLRLR